MQYSKSYLKQKEEERKSAQIAKINAQISRIINEYVKAKEHGCYSEEEAAVDQAMEITMPFSTLVKLEPINALTFLNFNGKMLERNNIVDSKLLMERLMLVDLSSKFAKEQAKTFISWATGFNYTDEEIFVFVRKLCKSATYSDLNMLLSLQSILEASLSYKCSKYVQKTRDKIKTNYKESKLGNIL